MDSKKDEYFIITGFDLEAWKESDSALVSINPIEWQHYSYDSVMRFEKWEDARRVAAQLIMEQKALNSCCVRTINPIIPYPQTTIVASPFPY